MKLTLTDDSDTVLDTTNVTREEWTRAERSAYEAQAILMSLTPGDEAQ